MYEPLYGKARKSRYGLLHFGGGSHAVIVRAYCSSTAKRRRPEPLEDIVALARSELMSGYEQAEFSAAIKQLIKLRIEEEARPES